MRIIALLLSLCASLIAAVCLAISLRRWPSATRAATRVTDAARPAMPPDLTFVQRRTLALLDAELPTWASAADRYYRERESS